VGVDIELITPRINRVAEKFLNEGEMHFFNEDYVLFLEQWGMKGRMQQEFLTLIWSAKEALFKWYGLGELDFKRHMQLTGNIRVEGDWIKLPFVFEKDLDIMAWVLTWTWTLPGSKILYLTTFCQASNF
jgi:phosphopantetheinyl transferase (holo-ACP synthase)